jgi:hypothetical protein
VKGLSQVKLFIIKVIILVLFRLTEAIFFMFLWNLIAVKVGISQINFIEAGYIIVLFHFILDFVIAEEKIKEAKD